MSPLVCSACSVLMSDSCPAENPITPLSCQLSHLSLSAPLTFPRGEIPPAPSVLVSGSPQKCLQHQPQVPFSLKNRDGAILSQDVNLGLFATKSKAAVTQAAGSRVPDLQRTPLPGALVRSDRRWTKPASRRHRPHPAQRRAAQRSRRDSKPALGLSHSSDTRRRRFVSDKQEFMTQLRMALADVSRGPSRPLTAVAGKCAGKRQENKAGTSPGHFSSFAVFRDIYPQFRELLQDKFHSNCCA